MADLIAIGYPDETTAYAAADEARQLAADLNHRVRTHHDGCNLVTLESYEWQHSGQYQPQRESSRTRVWRVCWVATPLKSTASITRRSTGSARA